MILSEEIMDGVIAEFNDKNLKFTMNDLAKRLGISKRTLYENIQDKNTLFLDAVDSVFYNIKESEKKIIEDTSLDIVEKIKRILIVLPQKYGTIDYRQLYELKNKYPNIYKKVENRIETDWEPTIMLIEQAIEEGKVKKIDIPVFKSIISGSIEHFISKNTLIENHITYQQALEELINIVMGGIIKE